MKTRTKILYLIAILGALAFALMPVMITGCAQTAKQVAYKSIYSVQKATVASYQAYLGEVINGTVSTNHVPEVSKRFNEFQAATLVAVSAAQWNTNAPPSAQLSQLSADLIALIKTASKK